jgi:signal peptidase I
MAYRDKQFEASERELRSAPRKGGGLVEYLVILLFSFALVFGFVRPFVVEAFWIPSESMVPTLLVGDRVLVNKFVYRFTEPERGDVVVFQSVESSDEELIKRVVGVPGDEIALRKKGELYLNGEPQKEPYVVENPCSRYLPKTCSFGPTTVPEGHVFVMGDNRAKSRDSRFFGPLPKENIEGGAFLRFWPPGRVGPL